MWCWSPSATAAAVMLAAATVSCGTDKGGEQTDKLDKATREELAKIAAQDPRLTGELENKTIKWMANWSSMSGRQKSYGGFTGNSFGAIARRRLQKGWKMRGSKGAWDRRNGILLQ